MANGARMEGIEADVFFTFFGLDAIRQGPRREDQGRHRRQPRHAPADPARRAARLLALATKMMQRQMEKLDIPPIPEFVEMIADSGAGLYACRASVDMFGLTIDDFVPQVSGHHLRRRVLQPRRRRPDHLHLGGGALMPAQDKLLGRRGPPHR